VVLAVGLSIERGRLEIDDSSVKWIDCDGQVIRLPIATIAMLALGPGTSITHEAVKVLAAANCSVCWVGEDSLLFYAVGQSPTSDTRNMRRQVQLACNPKDRLTVARRMYARRFPEMEIQDKEIKELMGMEGKRVHRLYEEMAEKYHVGWKGRSFIPGKFELSDITNQIITSCNAALYSLLCSSIYSMGYSPHIGFIHTGSPLPFIYDISDLYKDYICIDLAFSLTLKAAGNYNKYQVATEFRKRVVESCLLEKINPDIKEMLGSK